MKSIYKSAAGESAIKDRYRQFLARWPVPSEQLRVPTREGETFVVASGPKDAPALVLLHGAGINAVMWMGDVITWAKHFRVYAVDVIGEPGLSAQPRPHLGSEAYALWLDDVMRALSIESAALVGASFGGWLALDYPVRRPDRVLRVAALCPAGIGRQYVSLFVKAGLLFLLGPWGRRKAMELALGDVSKGSSPAWKAFTEFFLLIHTHLRPRMAKIPVFSDESLARLSMPLMVVLGAKDTILDSAETKRRLERAAPHAEISWLPTAGHSLPSQAESVLEFLTREPKPAVIV